MPKIRERFRIAFTNFIKLWKFGYYLELSCFGGSLWLLCRSQEEIEEQINQALEKAFAE